MGNGTIQAKLEPLARIKKIDSIYFLRKKKGPTLAKVKYILLPSICKYSLFNILIAPILLIYYTTVFKASFIISYHIIPYAFFAAIASVVTKKPYFVAQTGLMIQQKSENPFFWFFCKKIIINSTKFCVPGNLSYIFWQTKDIPPSKIIKLHSTIDTKKFIPHPFDNRPYDFIYVGRLAIEKRPDFLIKAFSLISNKNPQVKLLIVGDGPLLHQTKKMVQSLNLQNKIHFVGFQSDILPWLNRSKFILLTSISEGLPVAIMEGMSTGLIPLTTNVGNLQDIIIYGKTGFIVEKDDLHDFSKNLSCLIKMTDSELKILRSTAREMIVKHHSHEKSQSIWEKNLKHFIEI